MTRAPLQAAAGMLLLCACLCAAAAGPFRTFTDQAGRTVVARIVRATETTVTLGSEQGDELTLSFRQLSRDDARYVSQWLQEQQRARAAAGILALLKAHGFTGTRFQIDRDGYPAIPVHINGVVTRFIIDTGASRSSLGLGLAAQLKLDVTQGRGVGVGAAGETRLRRTTVESLRIGQYGLRNHRMLVFELNHPEHAADGVPPVEGLIGADFLSALDAVIDYGSRTLFLRQAPPDDAGDALDAVLVALGYGRIDCLKGPYDHLDVPARIGDEDTTLVLDTGAPRSILDRAAARRHGFETQAAKARGQGVGGALGEVRHTRIDQLRLGPLVLRALPVFVTDLNRGAAGSSTGRRLRFTGLIGGDVLGLFSGVVVYPSHRLYLSEPRHVPPPQGEAAPRDAAP